MIVVGLIRVSAMMRAAPKWTAAAVSLGLSTLAAAGPVCFDVKVRAVPVEQVPTDLTFSAGEIILSWPWFVDLRVRRVIRGAISDRSLRVLTLQHTYFKRREMTWLLRENSAGSYNVLPSGDEPKLRLCPPGSTPARPYIGVGDAKTLDELRDRGILRYGHHSG